VIISTKESCNPTKEPCISTKQPYVPTYLQQQQIGDGVEGVARRVDVVCCAKDGKGCLVVAPLAYNFPPEEPYD